MSEGKRIILLTGILVSCVTVVGLVVLNVLYDAAFKQQRLRLADIASSRADLITAIADHELGLQEGALAGPLSEEIATQRTLDHLQEAHRHFKGLGETGEFTLAAREGDSIVFKLTRRHRSPATVPYNSNLAEPMRLALQGQSGTVIGRDYRGVSVLAAYEPIPILNLGVVAKVDLAEIRAPFIKAGLIAGGVSAIVVLLGVLLFWRIGSPMIRKLRDSEERVRLALESARDGFWDWNVSTGEIIYSERCATMLGYDGGELSPRIESFGELLHPDDREQALRKLQDHIDGATELYSDEYRLRCKSGDWKWILSRAKVVERDHQGKALRMTGTIYDIHERKLAQTALVEQLMFSRTLLDTIPSPVFYKDKNGIYLGCNRACEEFLGRPRATVIGLTAFDIAPPEFAQEYHEKDMELLANPGTQRYEAHVRNSKGEERDVVFLKATFSHDGGEPDGLIGVVLDVTDQNRAKEELEKSEERYRTLIDSAFEGIIVAQDGILKFVNRRMEEIVGFPKERLLSKSFINRVHPEDREMVMERHQRRMKGFGYQDTYQFRIIDADDQVKWLEVGGVPITWQEKPASLNFVIDVTDRVRLQEEMAKADKLESIGILAAGIAHDFNNFLTAILGNISLAKELSSPDDDVHAFLSDAEQATGRASQLTRQLLTFAKGGAPVLEATSIGDVIRESARFALRGQNVSCEFSIPDNLPMIKADSGQMSQVINNLVLNAVQAMPHGGGVQIAAEAVGLVESDITGLRPGEYVLITILDEGVGMSRETLNKIFDPFYTTKSEGSGLGLASVYSIIKRHRGHIEVDSAVGTGSTFRIFLPVERIEASEAVETAPQPSQETPGSRILVLDDEESIRQLAKVLLGRIGHQVAAAESGEEAVALYEEAHSEGNPFDLVIVDLTLPGGISGEETFRRLREIEPAVRAIVASGYANDPIMASYQKYGFVCKVAKPYTVKTLTDCVNRALVTDLKTTA